MVKENDKSLHKRPNIGRSLLHYFPFFGSSSNTPTSLQRKITYLAIAIIVFIVLSLVLLKGVWKNQRRGAMRPFFSFQNRKTVEPTKHYELIWWELLLKSTTELKKDQNPKKVRKLKPRCDFTLQGKKRVTDSHGFTCLREQLLPDSCCPDSSPQFSCELCSNGCCDEFESCVSCCQTPSQVSKKMCRVCFWFFDLACVRFHWRKVGFRKLWIPQNKDKSIWRFQVLNFVQHCVVNHPQIWW